MWVALFNSSHAAENKYLWLISQLRVWNLWFQTWLTMFNVCYPHLKQPIFYFIDLSCMFGNWNFSHEMLSSQPYIYRTIFCSLIVIFHVWSSKFLARRKFLCENKYLWEKPSFVDSYCQDPFYEFYVWRLKICSWYQFLCMECRHSEFTWRSSIYNY